MTRNGHEEWNSAEFSNPASENGIIPRVRRNVGNAIQNVGNAVEEFGQGLLSPFGGNHGIIVTSPMGPRIHPVLGAAGGTYHNGTDMVGAGVAIGDPLCASMSGEVVAAGASKGTGGNFVEIRNGDKTTTLFHMGSVCVQAGEHVEAGQKIGTFGHSGIETGAHCDLEYRINGQCVDARKYISGAHPIHGEAHPHHGLHHSAGAEHQLHHHHRHQNLTK